MKLSLDVIGYNHKPESYEARMINNRICQYPVSLGLKEIADEIAHNGKTFCPAVFNGKRNKECFQQAQLIGLDYDGGITFPEVLERCKYYDLNIAFAYETFSSTKENQKFRVVFCLDGIIQHSNIYELIVSLLLKVFPEADSACRDCSRIFYGSNKGLLYNSEEICLIPNIVRAGDICMHNKNGHFARDIKRLAVKYGISITDNRIIIQEAKMGDFSPNAYIIYKEDGKKTPIYEIMSNNITNNNYFGVSIAPQTQKYSKTHKTYRNIIEQMTERCQMMKDSLDIETFADMTHDEHMCIMTNLIHVEGGKSFFMDLINRSGSDLEKWKYDWKWWEISGKGPYHCKSHCKYCSKCNNAGTILDTAIRKIKHAGLEDRCSLDDVLDDLKDQFKRAMDPKRSNNKIHLIKAQTGLGKTGIQLPRTETGFRCLERSWLLCVF